MKRLKRISFLKNWGRAGAFACAVAVALSVAFTACSNDEDDNSQPPAEEKTTDPVSLPSYTSSAGTYKFTQNDMKEFCGIIKFGISTNEIAVNGENNICCLNADLKIAGTNRRGYFFIPITDGASVTFEEETVTDKTIEIYPDSLPDSVKLADFTELKAGKITAVTRDGVTLKEPAKTKTAYKGTYRNNTFYCLPDTSAGGENTDSL